MKIIFFGTSPFAASILRYLKKQNINIVAIVTQPDRAKGRNKKLSFPPVKEVALELFPDTPLFQPEKASNASFIAEMDMLTPDLIVLVSYGQIIKKQLLDIPHLGSINVHPSLLPKYRGASPIRRCLMAGEEKSGVAIMEMVKELDAGDVYAMEEISIAPDMTFKELEEKMIEVAAPLLVDVIKKIEEGSAKKKPQDHTKATYTKKITPHETQISWLFPAKDVHNQIRALSPKPGAWTYLFINGEKKRIKILRSHYVKKQGAPGEIIHKDEKSCIVGCKKDAIFLEEMQLEGKKILDVETFFRGISGKISF